MTKDPRPAGLDSIVTPKISCVISAGFGFIFLMWKRHHSFNFPLFYMPVNINGVLILMFYDILYRFFFGGKNPVNALACASGTLDITTHTFIITDCTLFQHSTILYNGTSWEIKLKRSHPSSMILNHGGMERFASGKDSRPVRQRCTKEATRRSKQRGYSCSTGVRARQKDRKEVRYLEWFVKKRDCDIKGCTSKASNITTHIDDTHITQLLCALIIMKTSIRKKVLKNRLT